MFIKFIFTDETMKSCVLPFRDGTSSLLKIKNGHRLEVKEIEYAELMKHCDKSKVVIEQVASLKENEEPVKDPAKEPNKEPKK